MNFSFQITLTVIKMFNQILSTLDLESPSGSTQCCAGNFKVACHALFYISLT